MLTPWARALRSFGLLLVLAASVVASLPTAAGAVAANTTTAIACGTDIICIDGSMADWNARTTTRSYADNPMDQGGGSGDITAVRVTAGDGNLYVRWDVTLTSNKNKIAIDGYSMTVDTNRDGTADA